MTATVERNAREKGDHLQVLWLCMAHPGGRFAGSSTYSAGLLESTAAAGVSVTLLASGESGAIAGVCSERLPSPNGSRLLSLASPLPASVWALGSTEARARLQETLSRGGWTAAVIDHAAMGWALPLLRAHGVPVAYVSHNREAFVRPAVARAARPIWRRALLEWDAAKFARLEGRLVAAASLITAITPEDAALFRREAAGRAVLTLTPGYRGPAGRALPLTAATPRRVVLVGRYDWVAKQANLARWAAEAVPLLNEAGIETSVVGHVPVALRRRLDRPGLRFQGEVADLGPALAESRVGLLAEEQGGGFKMKTLDYIFHGLPVAALSGTLAGLPAAAQQAAIVEASPAALGKAIVEAIDDLDRLNRMQRQALAAAHGAFDWRDRGIRLARALAQVRLRDATASR